MVPAETFKLVFFLFFLFPSLDSTIDITLAQYQYISDHLTEEECHRLVAALHFFSFELSKEINAAERRLPEDASCLDLFLHWNSTPREGKGRTHIEVAHRLNQIGREDLAQWLSKAVFHELSKDLLSSFTGSKEKETTLRPENETEPDDGNNHVDEAAWSNLDSIILIFNEFVLVAIIMSLIWSFYLYYRRRSSQPYQDYEQLNQCTN